MSVEPLTQDSLPAPLTISSPPLIVRGATNERFLSRVTLEWEGSVAYYSTIEHWVEVRMLFINGIKCLRFPLAVQ